LIRPPPYDLLLSRIALMKPREPAKATGNPLYSSETEI